MTIDRALCGVVVGLVVSGCCDDERPIADVEPVELREIYEGMDCDDDGLTNLEEETSGSSPFDADTDGDGLLDGEEDDLGTRWDLADSDGDGYTDLEEVEAMTDPLDPGSFPFELPNDINQPITCTSVSQVTGKNFASDDFSDLPEKYYRTYSSSLGGGSECKCVVELTGTSKVTGISVFTPTFLFDKTEWANEPVPRGLWVEAPWYSGANFASDQLINTRARDMGEEQWFGFYVDPTRTDVAAQDEEVDLEGEYSIYVSVANVEKVPSHLNDSECSVMSGELMFRVDYDEEVAREAKLSGWGAGVGASIPVFA
ncbi:MAG: hypothetical protein AAFV53_35550, partial [Myxococcota bacterium]